MSRSEPARPAVDVEHELDDGYAARLIQAEVRKLAGHAGIRACDSEDIEQDLKLAVFLSLPQFDLARAAWATFVATVVESRILDILKERMRIKREHSHPVVLLSQPVVDEDGLPAELGDVLTCDEVTPVSALRTDETSASGLGPLALAELEMDVRSVIEALSDDLQELAVRLKWQSLRAAACDMGLSRRAVCRMTRELRTRFESAGF